MSSKLKLVLCWHMHQPEYRDPRDGVYQQPWTYLHAIKDYVDMVAHLERYPAAKAVVNFVPILLEQLDDYAQQIETWSRTRQTDSLRDPLLRALADPSCVSDPEDRIHLVSALMRANEQRIIQRFPALESLVKLGRALLTATDNGYYVSDDYLGDLAVWYHLGWMGETVRQSDVTVKTLLRQDSGFTQTQRHQLLDVIGNLMSGLFDRYRSLAEAGRIELSMTPYAHPIVPLLLDMRAGLESEPHAPQPSHLRYGKGAERVQWHLEHGRAVFERYFGVRPNGCWPSEGAISEQTIHAMAHAGFTWLASGDQLLSNSLTRSHGEEPGWHSQHGEAIACRHRVWQFDHLAPALFFRDDALSDKIGFDYQNWHADDAIHDFIHHLETIREACDGKDAVVSVILDGENAWEYYPDNGFWLLDNIYKHLSKHPHIELTTFGEVVHQSPKRTTLKHIVAGSWVYGTLSTWIGSQDKNRAWDLLVEARDAYERRKAEDNWDEETLALNRQQLAICEGSDWFWWFGDYNPSDAVRDFDRLYRLHLTRLYELLDEPVPESLKHTLASGTGHPESGGVMRRGH